MINMEPSEGLLGIMRELESDLQDLEEAVYQATTESEEGDAAARSLIDRCAERLTTLHSKTRDGKPRKGSKIRKSSSPGRPRTGLSKRKVNPAHLTRQMACARVQRAFRLNRRRGAD